jgi:hypothetical protein
LAVWAGNKWWNVEAAGHSADLFRPLTLHPALRDGVLHLAIDPSKPDEDGKVRSNADLLPDHGHLMHLYVIRWPEMDAVYHLHPHRTAPGELQEALPEMPPGTYHLYADIVHRNGFPETLSANLNLPAGVSHSALDAEDASAAPPAVSQGQLGPSYRLPDGYTMVWDRPDTLSANQAQVFRFRLLDAHGIPATNMRPYLGMAGHAAFVKTDGSVFAHTHPDGSAAMPAMMLANAAAGGGAMESMSDMAAGAMEDSNAPENTGAGGVNANNPGRSPDPLSPVVEFPYGFPASGRYRIFIQMKHGATVETGVFDAQVK